MKFYVTLFSLVFAVNANAKKILVLASENQKVAYDLYLSSNSERFQSWTDFRLSSGHLNDQESEALLSHFEQGLFSFHNHNHKLASYHFKNVIQFQNKYHLKEDHRLAVVNAFLFLSELASNHQQKIYWVKQAVQYDPFYHPEPNQLSKWTIDQWKNQTQTKNWIALKLSEDMKKYDHLKIGHNVLPIKDKLKWPRGHKISAELISNVYSSKKLSFSRSGIPISNPAPVTLINGSCDQPKWNTELPMPENHLSAFFNSLCVAHLNRENKVGDIPPLTIKDISGLSDQSEASLAESNPKIHASSSIFSNPWFWLGVGGTIFLLDQSKREKSVRSIEIHK